MTEVYPCLGHESNHAIQKWCHSACYEPWFQPLWSAIDDAFELSWELGTFSPCLNARSFEAPSGCGFSKKVSFAQNIEIQIACMESHEVHLASFTESDFSSWNAKPWSLQCGVQKPFSTCIRVLSVFTDSVSQILSAKFCREPMRSIENLHDFFQEPLSNQAVSIRKKSDDIPVTHFRRIDANNDVPSTWGIAENEHNFQHQQENDDPDANFFLHEAPDSVQIIFDALLREGLIVGPRLTESVYLRSWHINHLTEPRCWHPRILELNGHWRFWFNDILSGWRDKNDPQEETIFSIVHPNPPRSDMDRDIIFDIIVSQGLEAPRQSGLITVLQRDDRAARARYSVAASLSDRTSGLQIAQSSEIIHECNFHTCVIRHDGIVIPYTMTPTHDMQDGDSFTIAVSTASASSSASAQQNSAASQSLEPPQHSQDQPDEDDDPEEESSSSQQSESDMHGVHIFRLGHPPDFGRLRWDTVEHVLTDAARAIQVPVQQCRCYHYLQCLPDDHSEHEEAIILQHVHDIAPGSTEKLILVDIELHGSMSSSQATVAPRVTRNVHKTVPTLLRSQLLLLARVAAYCEWSATDCLVFCNRVIWAKNDHGPRRIEHGTYFRILIPPPPETTWEIGQTLKVFNDAAAICDFPEAGKLAEELMRSNSATRVNEGSLDVDCQPNALQCKGADLGPHDIDVPVMIAPHIRQRRLRPAHDGSLQWLMDLGQIFADNAEAEAFEDELMLYIQTWFVHHDRFTSCRDPRPLRLERQSITWIDDFRHLWRDQMQRDIPFTIHVVRPRPPQSRYQNYACHVLLEQAARPSQSAVVLTALLEGGNRDAAIQGAFSVPRWIRQQDLIDVMELEPFCTGRRCSSHLDGAPIHIVQATEVASGRSIRIRIALPSSQRPIPPNDEPMPFDDMIMLQVPGARIEHTIGSCMPIAAGSEDSNTAQNTCAHDNFRFNAGAPVFVPNRRNIQDMASFIQELFALFSVSAFSWEDESPTTRVATWFVDHRHIAPHCFQHRFVTLMEDFDTWEDRIKNAWLDMIDPLAPLTFHLVSPQPPHLEPDCAAHLVIVQAPRESWVTSLVSVLDGANVGPVIRRSAITTVNPVFVEHLLVTCGYDIACLQPTQHIQCTAWHDRVQMLPNTPVPARSGFGVVVHFRRGVVVPPVAAPNLDDENAHLQIQLKPNVQRIRLTQTLFPEETGQVPAFLIDGGPTRQLPDHVLVEDPIRSEAVEHELSQMSLPRHAYLLHGTGYLFCVPITWSADPYTHTTVFFPLNFTDKNEIIVHSSRFEPTEHGQMKTLNEYGFGRAVILETTTVRNGLHLVQYHNNVPTIEAHQQPNRPMTPWPDPMPKVPHEKAFCPPDKGDDGPDQTLDLGLNIHDLQAFFQSGDQIICPWHSHFDLPEVIRAHLPCDCPPWTKDVDFDQFDRLIIYTDGSSKSKNRRKAPLRVQEEDTPDAWAYVVIGETYGHQGEPSKCVFIGWHAQQVTYEEDLSHFLGTDQIGSEFSEREALFWAALWRLSINSTIPTLFRSDSVTTTSQALGLAGCADQHITFQHLRSVFHALNAILPQECLNVSHVRGHAGDPWNELADYLAKTESNSGHKLRRQNVNLKTFLPALPYLWMIFDERSGVPRFTGSGFDISPPSLPSRSYRDKTPASKPTTITSNSMAVSIASFNVGSLFSHPDGFGGKLHYLREQIKKLKLNVVGIQEARSEAGFSQADDVIRLASGSRQGCHGVELWINTTQPLACNAMKSTKIKKQHLQVLHSDPRRLLVRLAHPCINCHFFVLHAPQSGRPLQERRLWWDETQQIASQLANDISLYVMIDANAKTGKSQPPVVFANDDVTSANTDMFRHFLHECGLCLPCTTDIHQGPNATWTAIDGQSTHRIDFVAIPQTELAACKMSRVVEELEPGNCFEDHQAVAIQLNWTQHLSSTKASVSISELFDRHCIQEQKNHIDLSRIEVAEWQTDIESQVQLFNGQIKCILHKACPAGPRKKKKACISTEVWQMRSAKLHLGRRIRHARKEQRQDCIRLVFWAWKACNRNGSHVADVLLLHDCHVATVQCSIVHLTCRYYALARALKRELQKSKQKHLQCELELIDDKTAAGEILHRIRPFLGSTNPKKQKRPCLPFVRNSDGVVCQTPLEAQDRWIEYFCNMEGGDRVSHAQYRVWWRECLEQFRCTGPLHVSISEVPSLVDLEAAYRRVAVGKAIGEDGIPPELCRYHATEMARITYSAMLKVLLHGQEAIEHKGGRLAVAWKNKGDARECANHRSLLVSSHVGKTVHRALRQKHHSIYTQYMQAQQLGGRPRMPVGIPLHLARAFLRWHTRLGKPTALVFLDLTEAFYRVVRPLAVGGCFTDEAIATIACKLKLDPNAMHQLHAQIKAPSALAEAGASPVVQRLFQALHSNTWFRLGQQDDLVHTTIGSRPGDSFADIVFGFLWAKLLRSYEEELVKHQVLESVPVIEYPNLYSQDQSGGQKHHIPFLGPNWMDDLTVCLVANSNAGIESKACTALSILIDKCHDLHMEPNLKKGKTETMFTFRGTHSRKFRRRYFAEQQSLPVACERGMFEVNVVSRYLHLGGQLHHKTVDKIEVSRRLAIANQAFSTHRKLLYHNRCIAWDKRKAMFNTLVISKLMYGMESWTLQCQKSKDLFFGGIMKLYKRLLKIPHDQHIDDLELLVRSGMPKPDELLRSCRLRYFGTLHNCGVSSHWGVLQEDHAWVTLIKDDVHWLWEQISNTTTLGPPDDHYPAWQDVLVFHGGYWKKLIKRGIAHAIAQRENYRHALQLHQEIGTLLYKTGWVDHIPQTHVCRQPTEHFGCMKCASRFLSVGGEAAHMFRRHGRIAQARHLFEETHCPACLREYHTRAKVLAHLRGADHCRQTLIGRQHLCPIAPGTGSTEDIALAAKTDDALPFMQAAGPVLPPGRLQDFETHSLRLLEDLYLCLLDCPCADQITADLQDEIGRHSVSWTVCRLTLDQFLEQFTEADAAVLRVSYEDVTQCIQTLRRVEHWPFLLQECKRTTSSLSHDISCWEQWCSDRAFLPTSPWCDVHRLPRSLSRQKVILHAYAGRRRRGDIEWYLHAVSRHHPTFMIFVASVDIVIDSEFGDISRDHVRQYWIGHIAQGHIVGFIAGPPCNTWSRARHHMLERGKGPRVVRMPDEPWGRSSLSLKELKQVSIGTLLLGFALQGIAALSICSGTGFVEHPRDPEQDHMVSIWRLPIVHLLLRLPNMRLIHLAQGLYGAPSAKPTTLLVLGMRSLEKELNSQRLAANLPTGASVGISDQGQFMTAPLKEYPPSMCRAIAQAMFSDVTSTECDDSCLPVELTIRCAEMAGKLFGEHIGHDG